MFGDNRSVVTSGTVPHSQLTKRHHGLSYHYTREAIASGMVSFHHIPGDRNPADVLSKHWSHSQIWPTLQPVMFWEGDTADLFKDGGSGETEKDEDTSTQKAEDGPPTQG